MAKPRHDYKEFISGMLSAGKSEAEILREGSKKFNVKESTVKFYYDTHTWVAGTRKRGRPRKRKPISEALVSFTPRLMIEEMKKVGYTSEDSKKILTEAQDKAEDIPAALKKLNLPDLFMNPVTQSSPRIEKSKEASSGQADEVEEPEDVDEENEDTD